MLARGDDPAIRVIITTNDRRWHRCELRVAMRTCKNILSEKINSHPLQLTCKHDNGDKVGGLVVTPGPDVSHPV